MGMNNVQLYQFASKYIGTRGGDARSYCGLPSGAAWCAAFVSWVFYKGGDAKLWYGGRKVVYVPSAETWCKANLAEIPLYLAMPMDVITFDWNLNRTPDHIGFVRGRVSDLVIDTIEGNTDMKDKDGNVIAHNVVACRTRPHKYVSGVFRPHFNTGKWTTTKALVIDGQFGYNSIACLQLALRRGEYYKGKINGILDKDTVKALQRKASDGSGIRLTPDGAWGMKTSKAIQKWLNIKADGWWGINSTKSLQRWINQYNEWYAKKHNIKPQTKPTPVIPAKPVQPLTVQDKICAWAKKICDSGKYYYKVYSDDPNTHKCPICHPGTGDGWNCIGYACACWRHGGGIPIRCSCETINNSMGDKMLRSNHETALQLAKDCLGITQIQLISNNGKAIPASALRKGDMIMYFEGKTYTHLAIYVGDGKITDSSRAHSPQVKYGVPYEYPDYGVCKLAIRYTGK